MTFTPQAHNVTPLAIPIATWFQVQLRARSTYSRSNASNLKPAKPSSPKIPTETKPKLKQAPAPAPAEIMVDYSRWTKDSLVERVKELEEALKLQHGGVMPPPVTTATKASKKDKRRDKAKKNDRKLDPSKYSTRLVALKLAYLGKNYNGFEYQPSGNLPTIEEELWKALVKSCLIFPDRPDEVDFGPWEYSKCGRTDRGVSAFGQVIAIRLRSNRPLPNAEPEESEDAVMTGEGEGEREHQVSPEESKPAWDPVADEILYCRVLNRLLPPDIRILAWAPTLPPTFSARFSCRERQYRYFLTQPAFTPVPSSLQGLSTPGAMKDGWLDIDAMRTAAKLFEGVHDFRNFCKIDPTKQITNFMRRVFESDIVEVKDVNTALPYLNHPEFKPQSFPDGLYPKVYYFHVRGSAFLWHQIRHMVSILFLVGQGLEKPSIVSDLLDAVKTPRKPNYLMADEVPLVLWDCIFPQLDEAVATAETAAEGILMDDEAHNPDAEVHTNLQDSIDWAWVTEPGSQNDLVSQLWEYWRGKKMDELLASRLLDCMSTKVPPSSGTQPDNTSLLAKPNRSGPVSQRIFDGSNMGRPMGAYVPVLKRPVQASVDEINDKWAQSKGFVNAAEMTQTKNWRSALKAAKAAGGASKTDVTNPSE